MTARILADPESYFTEKKMQYIAQLRQKLSFGKKVAIYGGGVIGKKLFCFLQHENVSVDFFCVTDLAKNPLEVCGLPVKGIHEVDAKETVILVGV
ncbi:MAG: hypothetical protein IJ521_09250, partial [Schwartzia sp.]|nr:hypothetical protein [Schwartzia sp. (in: firmicutes)]